MDSTQTDAYLRRIGAARPAAADAAALRDLHLRHLLSVPFENLSIHLGQDIVLAEDALVAKVVTARRGGFCYELNGAFAALLRSLGYGVDLLAARVFGRNGELGPPCDHMALRVTPAGGSGPWLADVGFGRHTSHPLDYGSRDEQRDPGGLFRIADAPEGDLDVLQDGTPVLRLDQRPRTLDEFTPTCWYQRTSPDSHFRQSLVCSRLTADGRITLSGRKLVVTDSEGDREERELDAAEVLPAYREHFGIDLDREPVVAPLRGPDAYAPRRPDGEGRTGPATAAAGYSFDGLHHVQLAIPPGAEELCRRFWGDVLGMTELAKPPVLAARGGCWFRGGGLEVHLGVEQDFRPARKAHPGILVRSLRDLAARLEECGHEVTWDGEFPGHDRFYAFDGLGNRLEFLEPRAT